MRILKHTKVLPVLMALTILGIAAFQVYWLNKAYEREQRTLEMRTNFTFRETLFALQGTKLKLDRFVTDSALPTRFMLERPVREATVRIRTNPNQKVVHMVDVLRKRADSNRKSIVINGDTLQLSKAMGGKRNRLMQFLFDVDSLQDSVRVEEIDTAYARRLNDQNIQVPFTVSRVPTVEREEPVFNQVTLGFQHPITYRLDLGNTAPFILKRILIPILFSLFLLAFTTLSFLLLYRNLLHQRRLANIKNEFISNITHELKTPIATVSVAIEAMRSFNASMTPERSKEYLDISANELQRLSLLVDKVLKLSMFEKKEVELRYEVLDMKSLVEEVTASMRLQFEKRRAEVSVLAEGDTSLEGDRLHIVSVLFNLLDNALKYSPGQPSIDIRIKGNGQKVSLQIRDGGIGIAPEYHGRVFEKFFRVPTGNLHNAKGYGLGLSYVAHVIKKHGGTIRLESEEGTGSRFIISLPKQKDSA